MSDQPDKRSTTDPALPDGSPAAPTGVVQAGSAPEPGDPDYDAFLREVQRLADEREAAGVTSGTSTKMRTTVQLFALFFMATVGLAVVVAVGLGALGESEMRLGLVVIGFVLLATSVVWIWRIARSEPEGSDWRYRGR